MKTEEERGRQMKREEDRGREMKREVENVRQRKRDEEMQYTGPIKETRICIILPQWKTI